MFLFASILMGLERIVKVNQNADAILTYDMMVAREMRTSIGLGQRRIP
jgi:hypothetical protein